MFYISLQQSEPPTTTTTTTTSKKKEIRKKNNQILVNYINLPTGLGTIPLTVTVMTSVLFKISGTLLKALVSY